MSEFIILEADKREIIGKKVKAMRREGLVPAIVYGPDSEPLPLTINRRLLRTILLEAGGTQLIEIHVGKDKIPTLARDVQRDPVRGDILHVDFYRVSMNRPISADIPLVLVNASPVVESGEAMLVQALNSVTVEALPAHLPPHIEVDISTLTEIGGQITVAELVVPADVEVLTDENEMVVKADYMVTLEEEEGEELEGLFMDESAEVEVITERRSEEEED